MRQHSGTGPGSGSRRHILVLTSITDSCALSSPAGALASSSKLDPLLRRPSPLLLLRAACDSRCSMAAVLTMLLSSLTLHCGQVGQVKGGPSVMDREAARNLLIPAHSPASPINSSSSSLTLSKASSDLFWSFSARQHTHDRQTHMIITITITIIIDNTYRIYSTRPTGPRWWCPAVRSRCVSVYSSGYPPSASCSPCLCAMDGGHRVRVRAVKGKGREEVGRGCFT